MSKLITTLQIKPGSDNNTEHKSACQPCPVCHGYGYIETPHGYHGSAKYEFNKTKCSRCDALGHLRADITIIWSPTALKDAYK